jgi:hypothetical protein
MDGCYEILKTIFRGGVYKFRLGEQACIESKIVREENEQKYNDSSNVDTPKNIMGCKIDIILSSLQTNISSNEWKAENASPDVIIKQECKNAKVNASILEALYRLD